jgi:hypothetical protein
MTPWQKTPPSTILQEEDLGICISAFEALFRTAFFSIERIIAEFLKEQWNSLKTNIDVQLSAKTTEIQSQKETIADLKEQLRNALNKPYNGDKSLHAPKRILATEAVRVNQTDINERLTVRYSTLVTETIAAAAVMGLRTPKPYGVNRVMRKLLVEKEKPLHETRHHRWPHPGKMGGRSVREYKIIREQWRQRILKQEEHLVKYWL